MSATSVLRQKKSQERESMALPKWPLAPVSSQAISLFSNLCSASFVSFNILVLTESFGVNQKIIVG